MKYQVSLKDRGKGARCHGISPFRVSVNPSVESQLFHE